MAEQERDGSPGTSLSRACALAWLGSVAAALPTAVRTNLAGGAWVEGLVGAAAIFCCLLLPAAWLVPRAWRGLRAVAGLTSRAGPPPGALVAGIGLWASFSVAALTALGALLKATTHHRGLGGAAFGALGLALCLAAAVAAGRLVGVGRRWIERGGPRRPLLAAAGLLVAGPLLLSALPLGGFGAGLGPAGAPIRAALVDGLLAAVVLAALLRFKVLDRSGRAARVAAPALVAATLVGGFGRIEQSPTLARAMRAGGGLPAAVLWLLQAWADRDGDGAAAHFGGGDCDEGDPHRHPGAADRPGDGIDSDCDGIDGPAAAAASAARSPATASASGSPATSAATSASPRAASASAPAGERVDIILVTLDTVRADHTSAYGYGKPTTPALAALGERGVLFEHAYAAGCDMPQALAPLISGRPLGETPHSREEWPYVKPETDTVAERLGRAGYATAAVVSFTWLRQDKGVSQGFDYFDESPFRADHPERKSTGQRAGEAATALYRRLGAGSRPLFLWLHLFDAHEKYLAHPGLDFGPGPSGRYDAEVAFVDRQLAALRAVVDAGPRAARTLWVVHGSHGEGFGEHGAFGHGRELYDEAIRVPLVVAGPGVRPGRYGAAAVGTLDIAPTVLDLAAASREGLGGESLRPLLRGDGSWRRGAPLLASCAGRTAVIDWPLKLLSIGRGRRRERLLLFDLEADPGEQRDLSAVRGADLTRLGALRGRAASGER
ncbi:MAG: sulfatase-like hydrolase/transferase [Deltaproteobacteria bacterium]|nr:sulfatase-like hydrolase/transferase [Deltaproteobacteria bacterium]